MSQRTRTTVLRRAAGAPLDPEQKGERTIPVVASTGDVDAYREVIDQASWRLERFALNPVALYQHDRWCDPIGFYRDTRVEEGELRATLVLYTDDVSPQAGRVWRRYCAGGPVPLSVGFSCTRTADEDRGGNKVRVLFDCDLEEISVVTIPANPKAVALARAKGLALLTRHRALAAHHTRTTPMNEFEKYLAAKGMTPEQFREKAGISPEEYELLLGGTAPAEVSTKAATALEVELDDLLDAILGEQGLDDDEEGGDEVPPTKAAPNAGKSKPSARARKPAAGATEADLVKMLGARDAGEARVKLQALLDSRDESRGVARRVKLLEAEVAKGAAVRDTQAREAVLQKYRELGVLTPAREKGKVGAQLAKYKSAADVESYLDTLEPVADTGPRAKQGEVDAEHTKQLGLSDAELAEASRATGMSVEKLKASAEVIASRPMVR